MRTEPILLIEAKCFGMWWPGRELNPRRQPFQGCALPPELPGHVSTTRLFAGREGCSLHAGCVGITRTKLLDAGNVRNDTDYSNQCDFPQRSLDRAARVRQSDKTCCRL